MAQSMLNDDDVNLYLTCESMISIFKVRLYNPLGLYDVDFGISCNVPIW